MKKYLFFVYTILVFWALVLCPFVAYFWFIMLILTVASSASNIMTFLIFSVHILLFILSALLPLAILIKSIFAIKKYIRSEIISKLDKIFISLPVCIFLYAICIFYYFKGFIFGLF